MTFVGYVRSQSSRRAAIQGMRGKTSKLVHSQLRVPDCFDTLLSRPGAQSTWIDLHPDLCEALVAGIQTIWRPLVVGNCHELWLSICLFALPNSYGFTI